jgi:hypothetical protein
MVNASDAAALAAAQSCAGVGEDEEMFADRFAVENMDSVVTSGANITERVNCHAGRAGYVSVEYSTDWPLIFAGVLGFDSQGQVSTVATAHWGPTGTGNPIPLVIYMGALQGQCEIPLVEPGVTCFIWEDNDIGLGGGDFGFLDVEDQWNVPKSAQCNGAGGASQIAEWISGPPVGPLSLNYPNATWVCSRRMEGGDNIAWTALEGLIGETRDFPIVGPTEADGEPSFIGTPQPKYNVIGFAHFKILDVRKASKLTSPTVCPIPATATTPFDLMAACAPGVQGQYVAGSARPTPGSVNLQVDASGVIQSWSARPTRVTFEYESLLADCGGRPAPNASAHCLVLQWNGATIGGSHPGGGANFGINAVALCDLGIGSCIEPG